MTTVVALTGGIGSGKSTVTRLLEKQGAVAIDADGIVHELQAPGTPLLAGIARAFGEALLDDAGGLDRDALGDLVFGDPEARRRLEALVHPAVGAEMARRLARAREAGAPLVVLDIPLLFETRGRSPVGFDAIVVVWVPREIQIERTVARDGCTREEASRRLAAQLPLDDKRDLADHVIDNSGDLEATRQQVRELYRKLTR